MLAAQAPIAPPAACYAIWCAAIPFQFNQKALQAPRSQPLCHAQTRASTPPCCVRGRASGRPEFPCWAWLAQTPCAGTSHGRRRCGSGSRRRRPARAWQASVRLAGGQQGTAGACSWVPGHGCRSAACCRPSGCAEPSLPPTCPACPPLSPPPQPAAEGARVLSRLQRQLEVLQQAEEHTREVRRCGLLLVSLPLSHSMPLHRASPYCCTRTCATLCAAHPACRRR